MLQNVCEYGLVQSMSKFPEVVVLAGGVGKRFRQADPDSPEKPLIQVFGASQIVWALLGVIHSYPTCKIYIASRSGLIDSLRKEVETALPGLLTEFVDIGETTLGAAHSLKLFIENSRLLDRKSQLVSCDNDCLSVISEPEAPNFVSVMKSTNPAHCFVSTSEGDVVRELHEKTLVGSLALSGHYGFASSEAYLDFYEATVFGMSEYFLSRVVTQAMSNSVQFKAITCHDYFSLGTPNEIQSLDPRVKDFQLLDSVVFVENNA
jgi:hypothetical protein